MEPEAMRDAIPNEEFFEFSELDDKGFCRCTFLAFNTIATLSACGVAPGVARAAFDHVDWRSLSAYRAEGFSTTLLMLGREEGTRFARSQSSILRAIFVDENNHIIPAK